MKSHTEAKRQLDWGLATVGFAIAAGASIAMFKREIIEGFHSITGIEINAGDLLIAYVLASVLFAKHMKNRQQRFSSTSDVTLRKGGSE